LAAFLIVGITGIPYTEVMIAAALPALVYYLYLMVAVHIRAVKYELDPSRLLNAPEMQSVEAITFGAALLRFGHLLIAIGVLVYLLVIEMPPGNAAMYSLLVLLVLDALKRFVLARRTPLAAAREALRVLVQGLESGARSGAQVAVVIAVIGVLVEMLGVTGFAQKLSNAMLELAGGNLAALLIIAALACIAFGLGLPTSAAYILVAVLGAPSLHEMGVPLLAAHFFVFYYANLSSITPPVAVAAMVAANIAQGSYFRTAMLSVRLGLPGFLLPFMFVVHPEILGIDTTAIEAVLVAAGALAGVIAFNVAFEGFLLTHLAWWERLLLIPASVGLIFPGYEESIFGTILFAIVGAVQMVKLKREKARAEAVA
ncbi:MAG: TRAP transporter large permease subunit, partial [Proteobacteria bacterium]|nr:TRAP transporter large permease subunit [Pseudomonadota bacterium]